jgi:hypothetical protein
VSVAIDDLTGTEQTVLLVLMAESRPVPNPELARLGPELRKQSREKLNRLRLVETARVGRTFVHELTDQGWRVCGELFGVPIPPGSQGQGRALYTLLASLGRYFARADLRPADVFLPERDAVGRAAAQVADAEEVEHLLRRTYARLAGRPGGWVGLVRLRAEIPSVPRFEVDAALVRMYQKPGVSLIPEENQKVLTIADRDAAIEFGDQDKHLIAIEP